MLRGERGMGTREGIKGERAGMGFRGGGMGMFFFTIFEFLFWLFWLFLGAVVRFERCER